MSFVEECVHDSLPIWEQCLNSPFLKKLENGTLEEAWGCGTAAVVSPIGKLAYQDKEYIVSGGQIGEVTQMLYDTLTGIQWSKTEDPFGWIVPVC